MQRRRVGGVEGVDESTEGHETSLAGKEARGGRADEVGATQCRADEVVACRMLAEVSEGFTCAP